jgi:hypothetical protein
LKGGRHRWTRYARMGRTARMPFIISRRRGIAGPLPRSVDLLVLYSAAHGYSFQSTNCGVVGLLNDKDKCNTVVPVKGNGACTRNAFATRHLYNLFSSLSIIWRLSRICRVSPGGGAVINNRAKLRLSFLPEVSRCLSADARLLTDTYLECQAGVHVSKSEVFFSPAAR